MTKTILLAVFAAIMGCNNQKENSRTASLNEDWALLPFSRQDRLNPVMGPDSDLHFFCPVLHKNVNWAQKDVFNPAAVVRNDTIFLLFRAEDRIGTHAGTSRIGLAWSVDGSKFHPYPTPVLYPDNDEQKKWEWDGGCEDPRVVQDDSGMYYMTYTAYDGDKARLFIASSPDLIHWTKHGSAFGKAYGGKYVSMWTKSGSIVSSYTKGTPVAVKLNGKYWMYWGDQDIWMATSDDLVNWTPVVDSSMKKDTASLRGIARNMPELQIAFGPRPRKFDSDLVEPGPPAMVTDKGILLIYNSKNLSPGGDSSLAAGTYAAGQILFDKTNPSRVIERRDQYFIKPERPFEINGQVNHVCFVEGLVRVGDQWHLYYGTADSKIATASMPFSNK